MDQDGCQQFKFGKIEQWQWPIPKYDNWIDLDESMIKGLNKNVTATQFPEQIKHLKETLWKGVLDDKFEKYIEDNMVLGPITYLKILTVQDIQNLKELMHCQTA